MAPLDSNGQSSIKEKVPSEQLFIAISAYQVSFFFYFFFIK